ncbi:NAD(P)/FAD-dependent oxidoreductase [Nitrosopumilus maritimus]|uniref:Geranylgeranyl reductase n=1 Tax=Nitrosopumilus maritimus (strain SCM1) TaxID=436308 RepID=A9A398_NITMS|nr:NAD(P)/FAD-dependent oxidoreductase [Nitrosopumilus maritimus]ABX12527.1 geranylgeranyl reductase [Nitrosopumilus maritimus SCM1]
MSDIYDLVVVGGGPAGSSAAYTASKNGLKVILIEKEESIAESVRTSGVTWIQNIEEFGIPEDCYNPVKNFEFYSPNNKVSIGDTVARSAVLDVRKTYRWLASQAEAQGTEIVVNTTVKDVIKDESGKIIGVKAIQNEKEIEFFGKVVIDASGFQSTVAKSMGFVKQWERFGAGAEYEAKVEHVKADTWWLMVGEKYSPAGYAWIFPLGDNIARIGVGIGKPDSPVDPTARLKELIENKEGPIANLGKIEPIEFHYGLIPNDGLSRKTVYDNLILVGDSAGQANPLVLEGIRYAIKFGRIAGDVASKAIKANDTSEKKLSEYEDNWKKAIESKIKSAGKVQDRWIGLTDKDWDKELDIISELKPEEFLDFIKADFGLSNMLKLATNHPKLAVRQLFNLVKGKS